MQKSIPDIVVNGDLEERLPGNLSINFKNLDSVSLPEALQGIAISLGSDCTSRRTGISHVIQAIHGKEIVPSVTIRLSIGRFTSEKDIERAASELISVIGTKKVTKFSSDTALMALMVLRCLRSQESIFRAWSLKRELFSKKNAHKDTTALCFTAKMEI